MEHQILEAVNEMLDSTYSSIEQVAQKYSKREMFGMYLNYEGIIGYGGKILNVLETLDVISAEAL